jgi:hypothetical protein
MNENKQGTIRIIYLIAAFLLLAAFMMATLSCKKSMSNSSDGTRYSESYWISKKDHECLKEEDVFGKAYRYKIKLPSSAYDVMSRFPQEANSPSN